jgi:hypothetical protein
MWRILRRCLLLLLLPALFAAEARDPWLGSWRLEVPENSPYKRVTMTIEPRGDGVAVLYDMVGTRGGVNHVEWVGKFDGKDYTVQGVDYFATNAYTRVDDHNYTITTKRDGQVASTIRVTVSSDGMVLTATTGSSESRYSRAETYPAR